MGTKMRRSGPQDSNFRLIGPDGKAAGWWADLLDLARAQLIIAGPRGVTGAELHAKLGGKSNTIRPTLSWLKRDGRAFDAGVVRGGVQVYVARREWVVATQMEFKPIVDAAKIRGSLDPDRPRDGPPPDDLGTLRRALIIQLRRRIAKLAEFGP